MTVYRLDSKGRVVSIDGEVLTPSTPRALARRIAHRIRREIDAFLDEVEAVRRSSRTRCAAPRCADCREERGDA